MPIRRLLSSVYTFFTDPIVFLKLDLGLKEILEQILISENFISVLCLTSFGNNCVFFLEMVDTDGDGKLDYREFVKLFTNLDDLID